MCIIIVGNKSDLNYKVESEEAKNFTEKNLCLYYSISYLKTNLTNQIEFQSNSNFSEFDKEISIKKSKIPVIQTFESEMNIELYTIDENITNEISEKIKNIKFKSIKTKKSEISQKKIFSFSR